jgi:hypothetical protein
LNNPSNNISARHVIPNSPATIGPKFAPQLS